MSRPDLTPRQISTVLAALRHYQQYVVANDCPPDDVRDIATDGGTHTPLNGHEIDCLCEYINS